MRIFQLVRNTLAHISEVRITTSVMESSARPAAQRGGGGGGGRGRGRGRGGFGRGGRGYSSGSRGGRKPEMGRKEFKSVGPLIFTILFA